LTVENVEINRFYSWDQNVMGGACSMHEKCDNVHIRLVGMYEGNRDLGGEGAIKMDLLETVYEDVD
jgi:hypothetical protein